MLRHWASTNYWATVTVKNSTIARSIDNIIIVYIVLCCVLCAVCCMLNACHIEIWSFCVQLFSILLAQLNANKLEATACKQIFNDEQFRSQAKPNQTISTQVVVFVNCEIYFCIYKTVVACRQILFTFRIFVRIVHISCQLEISMNKMITLAKILDLFGNLFWQFIFWAQKQRSCWS